MQAQTFAVGKRPLGLRNITNLKEIQMEIQEKLNEELVAVSKGKRIWWAVIDIVLFSVLSIIFLSFLALAFAFAFPELKSEVSASNINFLMLNEGLLAVSALFAAWIVLTLRKLPFASLGLSLKGCGKSLLGGALFVVLLYGVGFGLSLLLGAVEVAGVLFSPASLLMTLMFYFLVAVTEELIVRGFILGRMLDGGINRFVALFASSAIFSLMHILNPDFAFLPFLNIMLAGCFLGASYIYTRNLCFPIALHWFWNWIQGPVLGYNVSGNEFGNETLLALRLPESNLINGGTFGFEGSILCSFLLILGTAFIIGYYERKRARRV